MHASTPFIIPPLSMHSPRPTGTREGQGPSAFVVADAEAEEGDCVALLRARLPPGGGAAEVAR